MAENCWEYHNCRRQHGGDRTGELGVCPASQAEECDTVNRGRCAGRYCWRVAGTLCGGDVQGSIAEKMRDCLQCGFLQSVRAEEADHFEC
ncbi:MAG: two-CW domain-containing protein [Planctomycetota bacterium]